MHLEALPAFADNYLWLLHDGGSALCVDPGDAAVVRRALDHRHLDLTTILLTHHHADHIGGVAELVADTGAVVYGPEDPRLPATRRVGEGDLVQLDEPALCFRVLAVPGHTSSHVAYFGEDLLFCGDTLFSLGCGRLFEGTPEQMWTSLARLRALPGATAVCPAHEYTAANLDFARRLEPDRPGLAEFARWLEIRRDLGKPSLPTGIARERALNPFLRADDPSLWSRLSVGLGCDIADPVAAFAALRRLKDLHVPGQALAFEALR